VGPPTVCVDSPTLTRVSAHQEQGQKARIRGLEAQKQNIQAAKAVAKTLRSSLGPKVRGDCALCNTLEEALSLFAVLTPTRGVPTCCYAGHGQDAAER
jgi:hypothetical protein